MKSTRKTTLGLVIINALCAIIWGVLTIEDITEGHEVRLLILHALCAIIWFTVTVVNLIRHMKER